MPPPTLFRRLLLAAAVFALGSTADAETVYVNKAATGTNTGQSWANAYTNIQTALAAAQAGDELWVAEGTYHPAPTPVQPGDGRGTSFALRNNISLYGGFAGTETGRAQRNWTTNRTILSGDLLDNDAPEWANRVDNSYHVITATNVSGCILDGFTVTGGFADGESFGASPLSKDQGSGANVYDASPTFNNIIFEGNYASNHGAVNDHGNSTLVACTFRHNYAGLLGAGLYMHFEAATSATGCTFTDNRAVEDGAGAYTRSTTGARVTNSTFTNNTANQGAGMFNSEGSSATISDCLFQANTALVGGAGVFCKFSNPTILNCTFLDNIGGVNVSTGGGGGGGSGGAGFWASGGAPYVNNCTFRDNEATFGAGAYFNDGSTGTIEHSYFADNIADEAGGLYSLLSTVTVNDCIFISNTALSGQFPVGGGASCYFSDSIFNRCFFDRNSAGLGGGGMYVEGQTPQILNSTFIRNRTTWLDQGWGGGILAGFNTTALIANCAIIGNTAQRGGGICDAVLATPSIINCTIIGNTSTAPDSPGGGVQSLAFLPGLIQNSIVWNNAPAEVGGNFTISNSAIKFIHRDNGNFPDDPRIIQWPSPGSDLAWGTSDDVLGNLSLIPGSPCIDAGDSAALPAGVTTDVAGLPRLADDTSVPNADGLPGPAVDVGAHEFQGTSCSGDFDADGDTGTDADIEAFFACLAGNCCPLCKGADFDNDGDTGTDADIESFFRVLAGGPC